MLKHQELEEEQNAAQVRVSPRELAEALTSLESRKAAEADRAAVTIALGEAIRQLEIEATPEELLQEVRALQHARSKTPTRKLNPIALFLAVMFAIIVLLPIPWLLISTASGPPTARPTPSLTLLESGLPATTEDFPLLSNVPLGQPVGVEYSSLAKLAANPSALDFRVNARMTNSANQWSGPFWTIKRLPKGVVAECWVPDIETLRYANGEVAEVFSSPLHAEGGASTMEIPITDFQGAEPFAQIDGARYVGVRLRHKPLKP